MRRIKTYAPGDGSLHFCRVDGNEVVEPSPTLEEAQTYFDGSPDVEHLRHANWRVAVINNIPIAVAPVRRTGPNTLTINDDTTFTYDVDPLYVTEDGHIHDVGLALTTVVNDNVVNVRNWSIRDTVRFFLKYENQLAGQPWRMTPFVFAGEGI